MSVIVDIVQKDKNLVTMLRSLKTAGIEVKLREQGPFTLLAPSEIAFGKLMRGELSAWLQPENRLMLTRILYNHILNGKYHFADLHEGQKLLTLDGKQLEVARDNGKTTIGGATVQGRDMEASNGLIHSLDRILMPPALKTE